MVASGTVMRDELNGLSEYVWARTRQRLEGLTDEEYLWEPVPQCWSLRRREDGTWRIDLVFPSPEPAPFTTLAWRIAHLIQCYGQRRNPVMLGVDDAAPDIPWRARETGEAAEALDALDAAYARWEEVMGTVDDDSLGTAIGPVGGQYAEASRAAFVLHMLDEFVHHGAEIAMTRDLYRSTHSPPELPATVGDAAARGYWARVIELVSEGAPVDNRGTTALHYAAGAGDAEVVALLLAHGADKTLRDPGFESTPAEWAAYFGHPDVAKLLES